MTKRKAGMTGPESNFTLSRYTSKVKYKPHEHTEMLQSAIACEQVLQDGKCGKSLHVVTTDSR